MGLEAIHRDLFGRGHISFIDYQNICSLNTSISGKTKEEVKEEEDSYFEKAGCQTTIDKLLFECNRILIGIRKFIDENENNPIPAEYRMDGVNVKQKLEYARISAEFIESFICCAKKSKDSFNKFAEENNQVIRKFVGIGLDFNVITGFMSLNKEYYDDVIVTAELKKMIQDQYDKDYDNNVNIEEVMKAAQRKAVKNPNN